MRSKNKRSWNKKKECIYCGSLIVVGGHEAAPAVFVCDTCHELMEAFIGEVEEGAEYGFFTSDGRSGILSPEKLA